MKLMKASKMLSKQTPNMLQVNFPFKFSVINLLAWKAIGILLFENNKIESALKYFEKAVSFDSKDLETKIYIGNCHYELQVFYIFIFQE